MTSPRVRGYGSAVAVFCIAVVTLIAVGALTLRLLGESYAQQTAIREATLLNDDALRLQLDEETGLRGFLATRRELFLEPLESSLGRVDPSLSALYRSMQSLGAPRGAVLADYMRGLHDRWLAEVARPSLRNPDGSLAYAVRGKTLMDRFRTASAEVRTTLASRAVESNEVTELSFRRVIGIASALLVLLSFAAIAILRRQRVLEDALSRERQVIETLQAAFSSRIETLKQTQVGKAYLSAGHEHAIGGDLFDVRRLDDKRGYILVADVSGKGVPAAVDTALVRHTVNTLAAVHADACTIVAAVNDTYLRSRNIEDAFVVLFFAMFNASTFSLTYCSAGHSSAFLKRGSAVEQLKVSGPAIGIMPGDLFGSHTIRLQADDMLVVATDGLSEARNAQREMLTDSGAIDWIRESSERDPQRLVDELLIRLKRFSGGAISDDLALIAVSIQGVPMASDDEVLNEIAVDAKLPPGGEPRVALESAGEPEAGLDMAGRDRLP